jgi:hypothetical protein
MPYSEKQKFKPSNVNYTSKDFSAIKSDLVEYTKAYFPDTYKDFNETSPGMMLIELASYVGDVLSYYIDYNYKENVLATATEKRNVRRLAEFMGYKTTPSTAALVKLKVTTDIDADSSTYEPDYGSLPTNLQSPIGVGLQVKSNVNTELKFETLGEIDFTISGSDDVPPVGPPTSFNSNGLATGYTLTRYVQAISAETKTKSFTISSPTKFLELDLGVSNVIEILDCRDSSGQKWYEVDYLTQDRILKQTHYLTDGRGRADNQDPVGGLSASIDIPYTLEYIKTNKKFVKKTDPNTNTTKLQFGNGLYRLNISGSSGASLFSIIEQQGISLAGVPNSVINASINNLTVNNSLNLGETPANTIMTVTYRVGGGPNANAQAGEVTEVQNAPSGVTITVNNPEPASGGTDGQTVDEIRENAKAYFASQLRCVTREDYQARILNLPAKFGNIAKCYVHRNNDISSLKVYTMSYNNRRQLVQTPELILNNLKIYLEQFRMINDSLDCGFKLNNIMFSGYHINFGVNFEVNYDRRFNSADIKLETIDVIKDFFKVGKMQFKQAINLSDLRYNILSLDGVIGIKVLKLFQNSSNIENFPAASSNRTLSNYQGDGSLVTNGESGYGFVYEFGNATVDDIVRPSATPAIFELRNPDRDIYGRVV